MTHTKNSTSPQNEHQGRNRRLIGFAALVSLLLLFAATLSALPQAAGPDGGERGGPGKIGRLLPPPGYLGLDDEQIAATQEIFDELRATVQPLREQQREQRRAVRELLQGDAPDATTVGELVISSHDLRQQMRQALEQADADFSALLDAEQLSAWENFKELRRAHRRQGRGPGGGFGDGPGDEPIDP